MPKNKTSKIIKHSNKYSTGENGFESFGLVLLKNKSLDLETLATALPSETLAPYCAQLIGVNLRPSGYVYELYVTSARLWLLQHKTEFMLGGE